MQIYHTFTAESRSTHLASRSFTSAPCFLIPRSSVSLSFNSAADWIQTNRTSYTHAVCEHNWRYDSSNLAGPTSLVSLSVLLATHTHGMYTRLWTNALSATFKRQSVVAFFVLFFSLMKVTFIWCASAKMATPHSGYTPQLLWKTKCNAHAPPLNNRFPYHNNTHRLSAYILPVLDNDAVYKVVQSTLFMVAYLFNGSLHYFVVIMETH